MNIYYAIYDSRTKAKNKIEKTNIRKILWVRVSTSTWHQLNSFRWITYTPDELISQQVIALFILSYIIRWQANDLKIGGYGNKFCN